MFKRSLTILGFCFLCSCASYSTKQTDLSYDSKDAPKREITTRVRVTTFFSAKSEIAKSATSQTDKNQTSKVGSVGNSSTNDVLDQAKVEALLKLLGK